jgi:hypothetical protein
MAFYGTPEAVPFSRRKISLIEGEDCVQAVAAGEVDEGGVGELDADVAVPFSGWRRWVYLRRWLGGGVRRKDR